MKGGPEAISSAGPLVRDDESRTPAAPKPRLTMSQRETAWGLVFLSPWLIGLVLLTALPMIASLVLSFTSYDLAHPGATRFVGIDNYLWMFRDRSTTHSFLVTLKLGILLLPATILAALGLAILLNNKFLVGKRYFRTLFFMPAQIPIVASVLIWYDFLGGRGGWMRGLMEGVARLIALFTGLFPFLGDVTWNLNHYNGPSWFQDVAWAHPGLVLIGLWGIGPMMLIFLAGLRSIPTELYEAAEVDGAGSWSRFRNVTLPMISPVFFYNLLLAIVGYSQYFTQAIMVSASGGVGSCARCGDPGGETLVYNLKLWDVAWSANQMGKACALAWLMFAIVLAISVALFRTSARWVFYGGADR